jgi:hypothetical protein
MYLLLHVNKHGKRTDMYPQLQFQAEKKTALEVFLIFDIVIDGNISIICDDW